jgi:hypothetical protein
VKSASVVAIFALIALVFFYDVLIGPNVLITANPARYDPWRSYASEDEFARTTYMHDAFFTYLPRRVLLNESLRSGRFPLWNPNILAGTPFFADVQARCLYPVELVLLSLDPARAMGYDIAIHVFLAMLGMYLFLRTIGVTRLGGLLGGCAYAFSSYFYFRYDFPTLIASAAWIPFFFYGFEVARKRGYAGTLLLAAFFALGYLAGFPQVLLFGVGAVVFYGLYMGLSSRSGDRAASVLRAGKILGIAGVLSMLLVSVQLVPFLDLYRNSVGFRYPPEHVLTVFLAPAAVLMRSIFPGILGNPLEGTDWSDLPREMVHPYNPDFAVYCGAGTLILALVALSRVREIPHTRVFLILLVSSVVVAISGTLLRIAYALLPMFRASRTDRIEVLACFAISAMAGIGFSLVARRGPALKKHLVIILIAVVAFTLVSSLALELAGEQVFARFSEKARSLPAGHWAKLSNYTRSGKVRQWAEHDLAGWISYERKALRRGLLAVVLSAVLLLGWALLRSERTGLKVAIGAIVVLAVIIDVVAAARTYYLSQPADSIWETEGIRRLKRGVGDSGRWRIRTLQETLGDAIALPCNTNQIFGVPSVEGVSTVFSRSYSGLQRIRFSQEGAIVTPTNMRSSLASPLDDLMGVRFLVAEQGDPAYAYPPVFKTIAFAADSLSPLGVLTLGGQSRLALRQEPGETLTLDLAYPPVDTLCFEIGFTHNAREGGDSIYFSLLCESDSDSIRYSRGLDLVRDGGQWHRGKVDLASLEKGAGRLTASVRCDNRAGTSAVEAGWSRFEYVVRHCPVRAVRGGYETDAGLRGRALSLELTSPAREIPLDIGFADGTSTRRWIASGPGVGSRVIWIDLKGKQGAPHSLRSDSTFSVLSCSQVWRGITGRPGCQLIYDGDMCIYENTRAVEKGVCLGREWVEKQRADEDSTLRLSEVDDIDAARCGSCDIVSYEPEHVDLIVKAEREGYLVFQDMAYPGWEAYVDGTRSRFVPTDIGIRALAVPPGEHRIEMSFRPRSLKAGFVLTCLGILLTLGWLHRIWHARGTFGRHPQ